MRQHVHGWSIVELVVTMLIVAILALMATSLYRDAQAKVASNSLREGILAALLKARSEATGREHIVIMCPSTDRWHCADTEAWHHGFVLIADQNGNGRPDATESRLFSQTEITPHAHALSSRGRRLLRFHPNAGNAGSNVTFTFCDRRGAEFASGLAMSNTGNYREVDPAEAALAGACAGFG
ncbi:hypothetical protein C7S18_05660 [Ahniella affigens]|uniref:Type II secretion system protein H n=1 Tax=Ahniella affigens TaxID=2021234 RepID=A0A2P1PPF9_9GAMM|nr:GspH/FimT family pseudopilin [Ahniella affigens]AVP96718.1 hypothetical protein C7S18_05660 [Ahniella affigens]